VSSSASTALDGTSAVWRLAAKDSAACWEIAKAVWRLSDGEGIEEGPEPEVDDVEEEATLRGVLE
jgi:hypothetical protein